jgi:hypothetical protein
MRSSFTFSKERRSPSSRAIRAWVQWIEIRDAKKGTETDPHLGALDFPLIPVAFIFAPFSLEIVENAGKIPVLATLEGRRRDLVLLLLLLLLLLRVLLLAVLL